MSGEAPMELGRSIFDRPARAGQTGSASRVILSYKAADLPGPHKRESCRLCGHRNGYLGHVVKSNGSIGIRWVCDRCEKPSLTDIPHSFIDPIPSHALPKVFDHSDQPSLMPGCQVCDRQAEEFHHWAPLAIFPDWPDAGVYLCQDHHREWHARMREHGLRWPHEREEPT